VIHRKTDRKSDIQTDKQIHTLSAAQTTGHIDTQTDSETCKQTDSETDKHTNVEKPDTQIVLREDIDGQTTFSV
jgi:tRNA U54 and U55 pseudouridine synthase Pus10